MDGMNGTSKDENTQLKTLNRWLVGLVLFILLWSGYIFFYVQKRTEDKPPSQVVYIDPVSGNVTNIAYSNLFPKTPTHPSKTNESPHPFYEHKDSYEKMDFVIVNYFFIEGLVIDKSGDNYTIMYKDFNRVLQKITVPKELLLSPAPGTAVDPTSLIAP